MQELRRISAWIPLLAGLALLAVAARHSIPAFCLVAIPGSLMTAGGARSLVFTDLRAAQMVAIGAVAGLLVALPLGLLAGRIPGLVALVLSLAAWLACGWFQIRLGPVVDEVPAPAPTLVYGARVSLDNTILGFMAALTPRLTPRALSQAVDEAATAYAHFVQRGYIDAPGSFHTRPPAIVAPVLRPLRIRGQDCEHLRFDSEFEPEPGLPGRERWLGYTQNRTAHAVILRHGRPGPWLVCVHGFGMGAPKQDFQAFRAAHLHHAFGVNVALFTLPVHGPRSPGGFNGEKFFSVSPLDFLHAETNAIWDLRRLIAWIRSQDATAVGVFGISLGGYTSAVLAGVEDNLACVIAGVPPTDMIAHREYLASPQERRVASIAGVDLALDRALYRVVAPLDLPPRVPLEGRFMFAATGDQFVPVEQVHALW